MSIRVFKVETFTKDGTFWVGTVVPEVDFRILQAAVRDLIYQLKDQGCILPAEIDRVAELVDFPTPPNSEAGVE